MIELQKVTAGYEGAAVLHDISLQFDAGQRISIIGPNGCGKTTLLKVIARLLPCMQGAALLNGQNLARLNRAQIGMQLAMMAQMSNAYFPYTVYETVKMGCYLHQKKGIFGQDGQREKQITEECLASVGLLELRNRSLFQLSGGQLQRVFLARAFAQTPKVLLLDEPTNHLDLKNQVELFAFVKGWVQKTGGLVVQVLHDINMAAQFSDAILLMHEGRVEAFGPPATVLQPSLLKQVYRFDIAAYMKAALRQWEEIEDGTLQKPL